MAEDPIVLEGQGARVLFVLPLQVPRDGRPLRKDWIKPTLKNINLIWKLF